MQIILIINLEYNYKCNIISKVLHFIMLFDIKTNIPASFLKNHFKTEQENTIRLFVPGLLLYSEG